MTGYLYWVILTALTGSPVTAALILVVSWFAVDRVTLGLFPDPVRWVGRLRRCGVLERRLLSNPHDRQASRELAELMLLRNKPTRAIALLKPNLAAGDDDAATVFTMGVACLKAGHRAQGEQLLAHVEALVPNFRVGEVPFALGRAAHAAKDWPKAKEALEKAVQIRRGSVEARVRLALVLEALGDDAKGALLKDEAWNEYVSAPRFQRRQERWWAWRARPNRPITYLMLLVMGLILFGRFVAPAIVGWAEQRKASAYDMPYVDPRMGQHPDEE